MKTISFASTPFAVASVVILFFYNILILHQLPSSYSVVLRSLEEHQQQSNHSSSKPLKINGIEHRLKHNISTRNIVSSELSTFEKKILSLSEQPFNKASSLWSNKQGHLYIAEAGSKRILEIDSNGELWAVAGNGESSVHTQEEAADARLVGIDTPYDIIGDNRGNLYFTECDFNRIQKVELSTYRLTVVAGDLRGESGLTEDGYQARGSKLSCPWGIYLDSAAEDVYFVEHGTCQIRRINSHTGWLETIAGNGRCGGQVLNGAEAFLSPLNSPYNLFINQFGDIFFTENALQQVFRIHKSTNLIELFAGDGTSKNLKNGLHAKKASFISPMGIVGKFG
jgi:hypothetical protein